MTTSRTVFPSSFSFSGRILKGGLQESRKQPKTCRLSSPSPPLPVAIFDCRYNQKIRLNLLLSFSTETPTK
ncbi:hypothetical protein V6N13_056939 [Hibiscus sabdariffa]